MTHREAVRCSHVSFQYDQMVCVLDQVDFSISHGEWVGVIGPNGGGKTTLLRLILGFSSPLRGEVLIYGRTPQESWSRMGYVPQRLGIDMYVPCRTFDVVATGSYGSRSLSKDKTLDWITRVGLEEHAYVPFQTLSVGQQQRALFARAMVGDPDFLILDEPTASCDQTSRGVILDCLREVKGRVTVLMVTHDIDVAVKHCDRFICMYNKVVVCKPKEVCEHLALGLYHVPLQKAPCWREMPS